MIMKIIILIMVPTLSKFLYKSKKNQVKMYSRYRYNQNINRLDCAGCITWRSLSWGLLGVSKKKNENHNSNNCTDFY